MKSRIVLLAALVAAFVSAPVAAQTLYKLIDKKGKVTYVDAVPKDFDGQVIPVEVDQKRNTTDPLVPPGTAQRTLTEKPRAADAQMDRIRLAREKVEAARRNLAFARDNPQEGEVNRVGNVGGGTRPVFSEGYEKRIAMLEQAVRDAEEELRRAEGR